MARFYFFLDGDIPADGAEPIELPDLDAAKATAVRFLGESLIDRAEGFGTRGLRLIVADEARRELFALHVTAFDTPSMQVTVEPKPA